jgi:two-component system, LytTR family, response regulator
LRTVVVEDEVHSRRYLCELLAQEPDIAVIGEVGDGLKGVDLIRTLSPDAVFLDIQMPGLDGFELIEELGFERMPAFVFVTAYAEHAVRAFEFEAVDYLCKPFDRDRLQAALERLRRRLCHRSLAGVIQGDTLEGARDGKWLARIAVKTESGAVVFLPTQQILWLESANKYVVLRTTSQSFILRQTLQNLTAQLDPTKFIRIHRCTVVRKGAIREAHPLFHGDFLITLHNGAELTLSRTWRDSFFEQMNW